MAENTAQYQAIIDSPVAKLGIKCSETHLLEIDFLAKSKKQQKPNNYFASTVVQQLAAYFSNPNFKFTLPIKPQGTVYQNQVWRQLVAIAAGKTLSYGMVAEKIESGARAVGNACRANPTPIVVPCHRVVAVAGLGGFAGKTKGLNLVRKTWLLEHEGVCVSY